MPAGPSTGDRFLPRTRRPAALDAGRAAWLAAVPAAALVLAAMALLGPGLGRLLLSPPHLRFWPEMMVLVRPEPTEHARFLIALTMPAVLIGLTALATRHPPRLEARTTTILVRGAQLAVAASVAICFALQWFYRYPEGDRVRWFLAPTLVIATAVAAAIVAGVRNPRTRAQLAAWTEDSSGRRAAALLVAGIALVLTLLPAIATDDSLLLGHDEVMYHLQFTYDETMAVVDGRSPLGDFATQYASLWPYALAAAMQLLGTSVLGFTLAVAVLTGAALLALLDVLRRLTRSAIVAVLLFLPLLATSAFRLHGPADMRFSLVNYYGTMPLRYAGPFLLAWLLTRHLDQAWPRRAWPLFAIGWLVAINNVDFGVPALAGLATALACTRERLDRASLSRLARDATIGLAGAALLICGLLLLRTGALPDVSLPFRYAEVFARAGFAMNPITPRLGMSTIMFATEVAAVAVAAVRSMRREPDRRLTGLLAWSGVFGLGSGSYYVGHSIAEVLTNLFPIWAFTVVLLTIAVVRRLAQAGAGSPTLPELACLLAFGALVCSLGQTPRPWTELQRIAGHAEPVLRMSRAQAFASRHASPGEHVVMLMQLGHRVADDAGIVDVDPYTGLDSIKTIEQFEETLRALRREGGRKVFVAIDPHLSRLFPLSLPQSLPRFGFRLAAQTPDGALELWIAT